MFLKNILLLVVLMNFGIFNFGQGETIRGMDIPRINVTAVSGKWYLLGSNNPEDRYRCMFTFVRKESENKFTMSFNRAINIASKTNDRNSTNTIQRTIVEATMEDDSNIISIRRNNLPDGFIVIFDVDYNSHMSIYTADSKSGITSGNQGSIFVLAREYELPLESLKKAARSNFSQHGMNYYPMFLNENDIQCE